MAGERRCACGTRCGASGFCKQCDPASHRCSVEGCDIATYRGSPLCPEHRRTTTCLIPTCNNQVKNRGYCTKHAAVYVGAAKTRAAPAIRRTRRTEDEANEKFEPTFPVEPLTEHTRRIMGMTPAEAFDWSTKVNNQIKKTGRVSLVHADRAAVKLGVHLSCIWGWETYIDDLDEKQLVDNLIVALATAWGWTEESCTRPTQEQVAAA